MSLDFLSLPQRQHKMEIIRRKRKQTCYSLYIGPAIDWDCFQYYLHTFTQDSKVRNLFAYVLPLSGIIGFFKNNLSKTCNID